MSKWRDKILENMNFAFLLYPEISYKHPMTDADYTSTQNHAVMEGGWWIWGEKSSKLVVEQLLF